MVSTMTTARPTVRRMANKVPAITAIFWVIKILSTTVGETFADYLSVNVGLGASKTDAIVFVVLAAALTIQLRTTRYTPWVYWLCVVLVSIFGTQVTDFFTDKLGISLYVSTVVFAVILAVVFYVWHRQEGTLSITAIDTPRRESFYWGAILTTFALGTAAGDLATEALRLGFGRGSLIFGAAFLLTLLAWRIGGWQVLAFWVAYILTRPLGASIGDLLTQDKTYGGLGLGATRTSLLFFAVIVALVIREQIAGDRARQAGEATSGRGASGKGAPTLGGRADLAWAGAGLVAVVVGGLVLSSANAKSAAAVPPASAAGGVSGSPSAPAVQLHPASKLGDLSSFTVIVDDVAARAKQGDLEGAKSRIKDLEIAWDSAEAGLKPRSAQDWSTLDGAIDVALHAVRASNPTQAAESDALGKLQLTLRQLQGTA